MLRILHTGDVHLDSPFSGLDPNSAEARRNELRAAFTSLFYYAKTEAVDLILISGDLFDADFVTRETLALIKREFQGVSCPIVIAPGNHDSVSESSVWKKGVFTDNTYIFTEDTLDYFDFPEIGARVWGYAFTSRTMEKSPIASHNVYEAENPARLKNILCAHGDLTSSRSTSCPLTLRELEAFGADYAALGHVHNPETYTDRIAYSGCLEGRSFDETGHKGALLVTLDGSKVSSQKVRFSKRRYESEILHVDGSQTNGDVKEKIAEFVTEKHYGDDTILRLTLKGQVSPSLVINRAYLEETPPRVSVLKVIDDTLPMLDSHQLKADPTLRGEFYRLLEPLLESEDEGERERAKEALRIGLCAIAGEAITY